MRESKPDWYKKLQGEPFKKRTFTDHLAASIKHKAVSPESKRSGMRWIYGIGACATFAALIIFAGQKGFILPDSFNQTSATAYKSTIPNYETIHDRMLNAIDNYKDIKGTYKIGNQTVEFEVAEGDSPGSYTKMTENNGQVVEIISDGVNVLNLNHQSKTFRKHVNPTSEPVKGPRIYRNENGTMNYIHRPDPATAASALVTFPENYAFMLTDGIKTGQEKYLERDATIIEGKPNEDLPKNFGANHFKMWVDSETGVLLKVIGTNEKNEVVHSLEVISIQINKGVDRSKFSMDVPSGWKSDTGGGYVVHNGYYYMKTGETVKAEMIGKQIGKVMRIGDWSIKKEGDTNEFVPDSGMFALKGVDTKVKMVIKVNKSSRRVDPKDAVYEYQVVMRDNPVEQVDKSKLMGAKNDPEEVTAVIENIRKVDPDLYEFKGNDKQVTLIGASYVKEGTSDTLWFGTYLTYRLPEADYKEQNNQLAIQGIVEVSEYSEEIKQQGKFKGNSVFRQDSFQASLNIQEEFELNGLHWKRYVTKNKDGDSIYVGQQGNQYYEIHLQGKISDQQMKDLLHHFVPSGS
ncbi:sigma-E factor regulatory protein RseB domain-containing protein [Paenibacillus sp. V4I5]|uniref:sigma-E factor regulatory protein RseB domain-containing protein n=1 Tax=Paenibacillus sp. V4I5 TaxID=3042306 RepID=UPI00278EE316|nr:sigma-E factor regulatory protein RseB domain-containing protein [Paenibacillus sp. V4I5]MDQ0913853.1 outer membrane lipoprotein-sorting protein [Paenibacillus sp. V4I5]